MCQKGGMVSLIEWYFSSFFKTGTRAVFHKHKTFVCAINNAEWPEGPKCSLPSPANSLHRYSGEESTSQKGCPYMK